MLAGMTITARELHLMAGRARQLAEKLSDLAVAAAADEEQRQQPERRRPAGLLTIEEGQ